MRNTGANFHKASSSLFFEFVNFLFLLVLCEHCSLCVLWLGPELEFEEKKIRNERETAQKYSIKRGDDGGHTQMDFTFFFRYSLRRTGLDWKITAPNSSRLLVPVYVSPRNFGLVLLRCSNSSDADTNRRYKHTRGDVRPLSKYIVDISWWWW